MEKIEFMQNVIKLYGSRSTKEEIEANLNVYEEILKGDIDYKRLYQLVYENWEFGALMPTPKFIKEKMNKALVVKEEKPKKIFWYDIEILEDFYKNSKIMYKKGYVYTLQTKQELISIIKAGIKYRFKQAAYKPFNNCI